KIKNKLSEILEKNKIESREETKNTVKKFLGNQKVFPLKETLELDAKQEFMLFKSMNKIIKSIENDNFPPNYEKCKYCSTENCPVKR
ncbi:MAG: hypothetical protein ABEK36_01015, partial [Candidatus Aenigmatarchaeota archaeon]